MFCSKCGFNIADDTAFCPRCGTPVNNAGNQQAASFQPNNAAGGYQPNGSLLSGLVELAQGRIIVIIDAVLMLFSMIFALTPVFSAKFIVSENIGMFYGAEPIKTVFVIGYIISLGLLVLPLLLGKAAGAGWYFCAAITPILSLIWFFLALVSISSEINKSLLGSFSVFSVSVLGWLFLIIDIATIGFLFKTGVDIKKANKH